MKKRIEYETVRQKPKNIIIATTKFLYSKDIIIKIIISLETKPLKK